MIGQIKVACLLLATFSHAAVLPSDSKVEKAAPVSASSTSAPAELVKSSTVPISTSPAPSSSESTPPASSETTPSVPATTSVKTTQAETQNAAQTDAKSPPKPAAVAEASTNTDIVAGNEQNKEKDSTKESKTETAKDVAIATPKETAEKSTIFPYVHDAPFAFAEYDFKDFSDFDGDDDEDDDDDNDDNLFYHNSFTH